MGLQPELGWRRDQLADLEWMLYLLDGKHFIPDNRHDVSIRFMDFVRQSASAGFRRRTFQLFVTRRGVHYVQTVDLVEKMNDIIAKHYPMLPVK